MSESRIKAPRGTYDVLGERAAAMALVEAHARELLGGAGYERIETPVFEATELFARGVGGSTDIVRKEMYTFEDGSGRSLTLRPEGTAPVCRAYVEHGMHKRPAPVKLWYLSSFFRYERAQAGRYRQFWQVGAEALGSEDPALDAEGIALLVALLEGLGARGLRLRISSLGDAQSRGEYRELLRGYLRAHEDELAGEVRARIEENPLRAFDSAHEGTRAVMKDAPRLLEHLSGADREHFDEVCALLAGAGVGYEIDGTLVRGLDYYTRTVFELTSDALGAQSGVGGGGRYDGLVEMLGGPRTPGMGWAAGIERIALAISGGPSGEGAAGLGEPAGARAGAVDGRQAGVPGVAVGDTGAAEVELFVALTGEGARGRAFELVHAARSAGVRAQMELVGGRSLKRQLGHADRLGAGYVAIVGEGEEVALKDMRSGAQETLERGAVVQAVMSGVWEDA